MMGGKYWTVFFSKHVGGHSERATQFMAEEGLSQVPSKGRLTRDTFYHRKSGTQGAGGDNDEW